MSRRSFKRYLSRRNNALNDLQLNQAYDVIDRDHSDSISAGELAKYLHEQEEDGDEDEKGVVEAEHDEETSVQVVAELSKKIILSSSENDREILVEETCVNALVVNLLPYFCTYIRVVSTCILYT